MALRQIIHLPEPILRKKAKPVTKFDKDLQTLIDDMFETMYDAKGIGLAATQVDVHERLIVIDVSEERDQPLVLINPEITWTSDVRVKGDEGCLSVPGIYDGIERATLVKVKALDRHGKEQTLEADGLLAVCIQHEMDHLMGKVFVDKQSRIRTKLQKQLKDAQRPARR